MPIQDIASQLDPSAPESMAFQLAKLLAGEIRKGWLKPGDPLPASRTLSEELSISRYIVMAALRELTQEGWATSRPGSGTYVSSRLPASVPERWGQFPEPSVLNPEPAFDVPSEFMPVSSIAIGTLDLREGMPDPRLAPRDELGRGYRRAMNRHGEALLGRGESRGNLVLREQLARYLRTQRNLKVGPENLLITRGTPMALTLLASILLPRGGHVALEDPGSPLVRETLGSVPGLTLHPVPVDASGLDTDALETLAKRHPLGMVFVSSRYQIPTKVTLTEGRRVHLLELAAQHGFAILEEDPEYDFWGPEGPVPPLASLDGATSVAYLGSISQMLATGLGLGFLVAPATLVDRLARVRQRLDLQGDRVLEWAIGDFIRDGAMERHLARSRRVYEERRETFAEQIHSELGPGFKVQTGGLAGWLSVPSGLDLDGWAERCKRANVLFHPGRTFDFHGRAIPFTQLGFGQLESMEAQGAFRKMKVALRDEPGQDDE